MQAVTRWDPFKELEDMQSRLSTLFGRAPVRKDGDKEAMTIAEWAPLVDISEDEKEYLIKAELPEVKKEDIKLTVHDSVVTITGERKSEKEENGKKSTASSGPMAAPCAASRCRTTQTRARSPQITRTAC